jgi:hypothetical protein
VPRNVCRDGGFEKRPRVTLVKHGTKIGTARAVAVGASGVVVAALLASPVPAFGAAHGTTRYANVSRAAHLPAHAREVGATSSSKRISGSVALAARNPAALHQAAAAVADPRSPQFHHYLAKNQFASLYGPTAATIGGVESALRSADLKVTSVSSNHLFVHFSGTIGQAESAFRTHIANFRTASGRSGTATTRPVSLPASVAGQVVSVLGLNTLLKPSTSFERGSKTSTPKPVTPAAIPHYANAPNACPAARDAASSFGGLTDDQIAHAYGVDGLYKNHDVGAGQTVAIFEQEPFALSDLQAFDTCYFGASAARTMLSRVSVKTIDGGAGTGPGSGESILDIDDVSAMAPGANIEVYEAPLTTPGAMDETNAIVQDDTAKVVTTSWGLCELDEVNLEPGYINAENQIFEQGALQGQSTFASSGDAGSDGCAYDSPQPADPTLSDGDPDSQPFVTSVGGTTITDANNPPSEQVWNDGNDGGAAGGGVSAVWSAPSWQQPFLDTAAAGNAVTHGGGGLSPCPESANGSLCREEPDVSAQADEYTGAITVYIADFGGWNTFGGTSSSAPLWAGMLADINASSGCQASGGVGFVSPLLYAVASVPSERKASFNDVTNGNNDVFDLSNGAFYAAHTGYDMASGLGTPRVTGSTGQGGLAMNLCALASSTDPSPPAVTSVAPATVDTTPSGSVAITGSGFTGAKALSIGGYAVPDSHWAVTNNTTIVVSGVPTAAQAGNGGAGPQDGSGRALISVTAASGQSNAPNAAASLLYVDGTAGSPIPSVSGASAYGGSKAGGNTITVFGSGFSATGADRVTGVTIGGVAATDLHVINPTTLTVTVPAYASGTTTCKAGDDQTNDVCQSQVVVTNDNGDSAKDTIRLPYTGAPFEGASGGVPLPDCVTGNTCEIVPSTTEYDYFAPPTITSVTTTSASDPTTWVSEQGDTVATIDGKGFDYLSVGWVNIGNPANPNHADFDLLNETPTELQVIVNGHGATSEPLARQLTVQTLAGLSAGSTVTYAGIPKVTGVTPSFVPDQGGGHIVVSGAGFQGISHQDGGELAYFYADADLATEQLSGYGATSASSVKATTPGNNPGAFIVSVCTITFCSEPETFKAFKESLLDFYEPGDPVVTSVSTKSGPASGGTKVTINGRNLSDAVEVDFGKHVAEASSAPQLLTNGSNTQIDAIAPPGKAGSTVNVVVTTVESIAEGHPSAKTSAATFTYKPSVPAPPRDVTGKAHATSLSVHWKAPLSIGGHPITGYRVEAVALKNSPRRTAKTPPPVVLTIKKSHARAAKLKGLRGGWTYVLKVRALNRAGGGLVGKSRRVFSIHDPA